MHASASERRPAPIVTTSVGKRSRTPTSLRTPTRHLNGHNNRPVTPTALHNTASRPHLHRANSHGASGNTQSNFTGIGPVPRSAKKWAKSSHLHEVRAKEDKRSHREKERENDIGDVFQSPGSPLKGYSSQQAVTMGDAVKLFDRKGKGQQVQRSPFSPLPNKHDSPETDESTENEIWVDTDADGSEWDLESGTDGHSPKTGWPDI